MDQQAVVHLHNEILLKQKRKQIIHIAWHEQLSQLSDLQKVLPDLSPYRALKAETAGSADEVYQFQQCNV